MVSGNSLRQTVHTHCASVHQAAKLAAALLRVARITAGLAKSNGSILPDLWLTSSAGWLPRTGISSRTLCSAIEYRLPLPFFIWWQGTCGRMTCPESFISCTLTRILRPLNVLPHQSPESSIYTTKTLSPLIFITSHELLFTVVLVRQHASESHGTHIPVSQHCSAFQWIQSASWTRLDQVETPPCFDRVELVSQCCPVHQAPTADTWNSLCCP